MKKEITNIDNNELEQTARMCELAHELMLDMAEGEKGAESIIGDSELLSALIECVNTNSEEKQRLIAKVSNYNTEKATKEFCSKLEKHKRSKHTLGRKLLTAMSIAAAVLFVSFLVWHDKGEQLAEITQGTQTTLIAERATTPILIFDDGEPLELSEKEKAIVNELSGKQFTSEVELSSPTAHKAKLITPPLLKQTILLADGTEVTLNSQGELRFPTEFTNATRTVELEGEAYFKVAKSDKPFIVKTKGVAVKVYGTEFNINSRLKESIKTVLIEGSVGLTMEGIDEEIMMKPNELVTCNMDKLEAEVRVVDPIHYISWLADFFDFHNASFNEVVSEISNWYGVEINYNEEDFRGLNFNMSFSKQCSLEDTFNKINKAINIKIIKETSKNKNAYEDFK